MAKHKSQKPAALHEEPAGTPVLDDEPEDDTTATTLDATSEGEIASDVQIDAAPPSAYEPEPEDIDDEEPPPVLTRSARKAGKQIFKVWKHGALKYGGKMHDAGSFIELTSEVAEGIACLELVDTDVDES